MSEYPVTDGICDYLMAWTKRHGRRPVRAYVGRDLLAASDAEISRARYNTTLMTTLQMRPQLTHLGTMEFLRVAVGVPVEPCADGYIGARG